MIIIALIILLILGAPLYTLLLGGTYYSYTSADIPVLIIPYELFGMSTIPMLMALPLFTYAGYLLAATDAPKRLVYLSTHALKLIPSNVTFLSLIFAAFFAAITGSSGITIIAFGGLLLTMLNDQYSESFSLGFITTSGGIGLLFAPSVPMILYAIIAGVPVYDFFYSGILPGLFIMLLFYGYSFFCTKSSNDIRKFDHKIEKGKFLPMILEILLPAFVLIGVYTGFLAIPEVAAITLLYVIFVEFILSKELNLKLMFQCLEESMSLVGSIFIILGVSLASTNYIIDAGIPEKIFNSLDFIVNGRVSFLIFLIFFLLIIGAFLDMYAAIIVVLPFLIPMAHSYDVPLIHLGIIFTTVMEIGLITPPIRINLFISSNRFEKSIFEIYKTTLPFFLLMVFAAMMIAFFPDFFLIRS